MGLDTTHGAYNGGYMGFNIFRSAVAKAAEMFFMASARNQRSGRR